MREIDKNYYCAKQHDTTDCSAVGLSSILYFWDGEPEDALPIYVVISAGATFFNVNVKKYIREKVSGK